MAEELADIHAAEGAVDTGVVSGAEIPDTPEKPLSIRESLTASIKEVGDKEQRARDIASGKFIPKDKSAAPEKVEAKETPEAKTEAPVVTDGPPKSWSREDAPHWEALSPEQKAVVRKRESDFEKGIEKYSGKAKNYDEIAQVLAPVRPLLQQHGIQNDAQAVSRLLEWESSFRNPQTRMQAFQNLARTYGIDLSSVAQPSPQGGGGEVPDHLRPVLDKFGNLEQQVTNLVSAQQLAEQNRVASELETFAKDKPHFETVRVAMGQLMSAGMAKDISDAYDKAVWANPELREQLLREQDEKRKAEFTKTQTDAANKARLAAVSPGPRARNGAPVAAGDKSGKGVRGSILASIESLREDQRA